MPGGEERGLQKINASADGAASYQEDQRAHSPPSSLLHLSPPSAPLSAAYTATPARSSHCACSGVRRWLRNQPLRSSNSASAICRLGTAAEMLAL